MKRKVRLKKPLSTFLAFALCTAMFMQGTLTAAAEETLNPVEAAGQGSSIPDSDDSTEAGNSLKEEEAFGTEAAAGETVKEDAMLGEGTSEEETPGGDVSEAAPAEEDKAEEEKQEGEKTEEIYDGNEDADDTTPEDGSGTDEVIEDDASQKTTDDEEKVSDEKELAADSEDTESLALDYIGVSELSWDGNGVAMFKVNDSKPAFYTAELYRDGVPVADVKYGELSGVSSNIVREDYRVNINESGNYTFKVKISEDDSEEIWDFSTGQVSESSPVFNYVRPAGKLPTPAGVQWGSEKKGVATWNPVENASSYIAYLYRNDTRVIGRVERFGTQVDFSDYIGGEGNFTFNVRAISNDITKYANSDWSENSAPLEDSGPVKDSLEDIIDNQDVDAAVSDLKNGEKVSKSDLQIAMQTDSGVQEKMRQLEQKYVEKNNVRVADPSVEDVAIDAQRIKMLGAALNADPGQDVGLKISKPAKESPYNPNVYKNMVQFSMDMYIGNNAVTELAIPVTITLPVPSGMNIDRLEILHYTSEGSYERIRPRKNGDGTVSFTITHFSIFAFAETAQTSAEPSVQIREEGRETVSSTGGGSEQPVSGESAQVQPWKPTTPDEIKRYACKGKEAVDYTLSKENAYPLVLMNAMQGPMCFASFESVLGEYTIGRTYNIYPARNLTYSMDQEAEVTIKIPASIYRADREYKMICVTKGGQPVILEDLDKNPATITFRTNKFYAFALIYK